MVGFRLIQHTGIGTVFDDNRLFLEFLPSWFRLGLDSLSSLCCFFFLGPFVGTPKLDIGFLTLLDYSHVANITFEYIEGLRE